jgi:hypothetical protein
MRKLTTLVIFTLLIGISQSNAQTEKSTLLLGGNASFQAVDDATLFVFNANLGVFVANNIAVGLQASIISSEGASAWSLGPYGRFYFGKSEKGKPFAQGTFTLGGGDGSDVSVGGGVTGGYSVFLNRNVAIELAASYFRQSDMGLFVLGAGFQIHFKKQK